MSKRKKQPLWCALLRGVRGVGKSSVSQKKETNYQIAYVTWTKQGSVYHTWIKQEPASQALDGEQE